MIKKFERNPAKAKVQIDNNIIKVTEYSFKPGEETTFHKHEYDYVVVPITDGKLLLIDKDGQETFASLKKGVSYFRKAGVKHNVINAGESNLIFVELEIK